MQPQKTWNEGFGELLDQEMMEAFLTLPPLVLVRFNALIQKHIETTIAEERKKVLEEVLAYVEPQMQVLNNSNDMEKCYIQDKFYAGMFAGYQRVRMHFLALKELN